MLLEPASTVVSETPPPLLVVRGTPGAPVVVSARYPAGHVRLVQQVPTVVRNEPGRHVLTPVPEAPVRVHVGLAGPQGIPGPASGPATFTATAATNLTYPCVVAVVNGQAHYADPTSTDDMTSQLAITTQAALAGSPVVCASALTLTEPAWNWTPGRIYLSSAPGQLTQSVGDTGAVLEVGRATSPTTVDFAIQTAVLR